MSIRLIATDLDGTLLNSDHLVSPVTEQALYDALAQGILFTVATGKTFPSTIEWIRKFNIQIPVICGNGTIIHAPDGTVLYENPLARDVAIEVVQMARAADMTPIVYSGPGLLTSGPDHGIDVLVAHHEPQPEIIEDLEKALSNGRTPHKLILINEDNLAGVADFQLELERTFAGRARILRSGLASVVEVLPLNVSKGSALTVILEYLNIPAGQVIAFGDNCNDLEMIKAVGIGVAMGHSPDDVRRRADYVTGTNDEDGVGLALRELVLDKELHS